MSRIKNLAALTRHQMEEQICTPVPYFDRVPQYWPSEQPVNLSKVLRLNDGRKLTADDLALMLAHFEVDCPAPTTATERLKFVNNYFNL